MMIRRVSKKMTAIILSSMMAVTMGLTPVSAKVVLPTHRDAQTFSYDGLTKDNYLQKLAERGVDVTSGKEFIPIPWGSLPGQPPTPYAPVTEGIDISPHPELGNQTLAKLGILDVTAGPFHVDNTGTTDVTELLQSALDYGKKHQLAVFLPSGTYLVSDTLLLQTGISARTKNFIDTIANKNEMPTVLLGSRLGNGTTIKLKDNAATFDDPLNAKAVLHYYQPEITTNKNTKEVTIEWGGKHAADKEGNITIDHINVVTGNNPGAIGIHAATAQGGVISDVNINATGGLVGIMGGAGNGGSWTNITVTGGKFGYDSRLTTILLQSIQNMTLQNQTHAAWLAGNGGSATVTGLKIIADYEGPAIIKGYRGQPFFGSQSIIDAEITYTRSYNGPAIAGSTENTKAIDNVAWPNNNVVSSAEVPALSSYLPKGLYLNNVYFKNVSKVIDASDFNAQVDANPDGWFHVKEFAYGKDESWTNAGATAPKVNWKNVVYIDKVNQGNTYLGSTAHDIAPPSDLQVRHGWLPGQIPSFETPGLVDVKAVYGVTGDGKTDDTAALQAAIDANEYVFLPKGYYRITDTLKLKPNTKLFGLASAYSYIITDVFDIPNWGSGPKPMVETADDKNAYTVISDITITPTKEVPSTFEGSYPLYSIKWQSGSSSIMRTVQIEPTRTYGFIGSDNAAAYGMKTSLYEYPTLLITGNGGGKIYNVYNQLFLAALVPSAMRVMAVRGTTSPLSIYAANWEYIKSSATIEVSNSQNVTLYGNKTEDNNTYLDISDSNNVRVFGHSGSGGAAYQYSNDITANINNTTIPNPIDPNKKGVFYKATNSTNLLITNLNDQVTVRNNAKNGLNLVQARYDLFWPIKVDSDPVPSDTRPVMYKLGTPSDGFYDETTAPIWTNGNLTASNVTGSGVTLSWSGASDNVGVSGYKVLQNGVELGTVVATTYGGTYHVNGLTANIPYTFRIEARDAAGNWSTSGPSRTVFVDTLAPAWTNANLTSSNVTGNGVSLAWSGASDNVGVTGYKVLQNGVELATVVGTTYGGTYDVTGLTANTSYTFQIEAGDAAGNWSTNGPSKIVMIDTLAPVWTNGSLTPTHVDQTSVTLNWSGASDNAGIAGYKVYQGTTLIAALDNVTSYKIPSLDVRTGYTFTVQAGDASGNWSTSGPSVTVTTLSVGGGNNRDGDKEKDNNKDKEKEKYNNGNNGNGNK
ncbi:glycosyl hydrolase family 28-related protein [Paenibacillus sp. GD4]|uniref:fibronectin type III domain-containing protein n=1 Tax=Paenibacillus sp. GD4 TaxID=3068890 RepID=UPI00279663C2|nr:glycosyl hydrolase family 28-related protein [Paenibacillus sp. GD4]MDQ1913453.1 glycosyl hydrolase family 28-related protein [Paenibacillus sp. GD4]